jgi:hypothetical protein
MSAPLPLPELLDEWYRWAERIRTPNRDESQSGELIGWDEFDWAVQDYPELAWQAILEALNQPRMEPYLGTLAAGPLEDLLSTHGANFIERVESEARANPRFAWLLGGVWQHKMSEELWGRVQSVWSRSGWDGAPQNDG